MQKSNATQEGWAFAAQAIGTANSVQASTEYLASVEDAIKQLENAINNNPHRNLPIDQLQGFMFEDFSAETFNIDAVASGSSDRAVALDLNDLGSVDVKLNSGKEYSLKSYATGEQSATEQARLNLETRQPLYKNQDRAIPTDQLDQAREAASRRAARAQENRPDVAESYKETSERLTDRLENDEGVSSRPVTRKELNRIAAEAKKQEFKAEEHDITPETVIKTEYMLKQAGKAGLTAAAITVALQLAPAIIESIDYLFRTGEIDTNKLRSTGTLVISAGGESFLRGSTAYVLSLAIQEGKLGVLKNLNPTIVGILVAVTIEIVKDSIMVAMGKMQPRELGAALIRTAVIVGGTTLGTAAIIKLSGAVGQAVLAAAPVVGYIVGTLVGCAVSAIYNLGRQFMISLCVDTGFTCFGLVEQDYTLPENVLHELGIETITIPYVEVPYTQIETVSYTLEPEKVEYDKVQFTMLKRGIIGVNRVGYVPAQA